MGSKPVLSLSTSWNSSKHSDGYKMLKEIADLGFTHAELSHGIRINLVPGVIKAVEEGIIKISSCHNFCPLPAGVDVASPNLFKPSSQDSAELDQWVRYTKRTIDFAVQLKARLVVMHLGSLAFGFFDFGDAAKKLEEAYEPHSGKDLSQNKDYVALRDKTVAKLNAKKGPYWEAIKTTIERVREYANSKAMPLGFENRESVEELPLDSDFEELLASLKTPHTAGYWHDTGHARIKELMLLLKHKEHLEKNAARLIGFHLHDVSKEGKDHQPVGSGLIDFDMISSFWRPEHTLVIELSPKISREGVVSSRARVEELLAKRFG